MKNKMYHAYVAHTKCELYRNFDKMEETEEKQKRNNPTQHKSFWENLTSALNRLSAGRLLDL